MRPTLRVSMSKVSGLYAVSRKFAVVLTRSYFTCIDAEGNSLLKAAVSHGPVVIVQDLLARGEPECFHGILRCSKLT